MKILIEIIRKSKVVVFITMLILIGIVTIVTINCNSVTEENMYDNVQQNSINKANLKTLFSSKEFKQIQGIWEITNFIDKGIDSHADDIYNDEVNTNWKEYRLEKEKNIGMQIEINEYTIESFLPAGEKETGYIVSNYENMFFGYKPPIDMSVTYPVLRFYIIHRDFEYPIYFILDAMNNGIIDVSGNFYSLKKID